MGLNKTDAILIVGAGAFGLSTALHLSLAGYTNITVLDKDDEVPSRFSAANDLNKILRTEYEDAFYTELALKALEAWQTPLFAPHFHQTGFLHCVSADAPAKAIDTLKRFQSSAESHPQIAGKVVTINSREEIGDLVWQYKRASLPGWTGYLNRLDGYAHAANALRAVYREAQARGVHFVLGRDGAAARILYSDGGGGGGPRKSTGVVAETGRVHPAQFVIVAAGAASGQLVPEAGRALVAKAWSVAHLELTDDEASALRGIPVTYARDLGFFFEPDPKTNLLKLCPMGAGFVNTDPATGVSRPPAGLAESAFMPRDDEAQIRRLIAQALPALAHKPLVKKSLCWFSDTRDSDFVVDYLPGTAGSVALLSGDSGHGFKMFPIVGTWVVDLLEAADGRQPVARWRWKEPKHEAVQEDADWGGSVSWRLGESREFVDISVYRPGAEPRL